MKIKELLIHYKKLIIIAVLFIVILLSWNLINSFSATVNSSAWDGVAAKEFASGTGTVNNPYVISNAAQYGYFKQLMEGEDASLYATKNYVIAGSFNYGEHDLYIDNDIPFSGVIDGNYNTISNAKIETALFSSMDGATIKNIALKDIQYNLDEDEGAILAGEVTDSNISMVIFTGKVTTGSSAKFGGLVYSSNETKFNNIILNYDIESESSDIYKFAYEIEDSTGSNILINKDEIANSSSEIDIEIDNFEIKNGQIDLLTIDNLDDYNIIIQNNEFMFVNEEDEIENVNNESDNKGEDSGSKGPTKAPTRGTSFSTHTSGLDGNTLYVNDLDADLNYLRGLNYTEIRSTSIPSGISTGYYDDEYLVKVELIYDGTDINDNTLVGAVSPIGENANKYVYYKYYALERTASGALATNSNGNNYIRVELIDNPFSKRPYKTSGGNTTEYGFNGWVCNDEGDASPNICDKVTMSFDKTIYTRYMDVEVTGGSQIVIYLNATWYPAKVVTSAASISSFSSMAMVQVPTHNVQVVIHHEYNPYWKQNYTTMVFDRTYVRNDGYMPSGSWYRTSQTSTSYIRIRNTTTRCPNNSTCYVYHPNTSGIVGGSLYSGGSVYFIASFNASSSSAREVSVSTYSASYMNLVEESGGWYQVDETVTKTVSDLAPGSKASGYYYRVNSPTSAMLSTREYYTSNGTLCTATNSCSTAYKLIQYKDSLTNSDGTSIYNTNVSNDGYQLVDQTNYYYLVTRDLNIFRYTSTASLSLSSISVDRPFTVTGTGLTSTSVTGVLAFPTSWGSAGTFTVSNDLVIENIKFYGPNTAGSANIVPGNDSKTSYAIYANSNNLKIGRNVTSSRNNTYLIAESILGGTNSSVSGTFKVIVESGFYYAYHSGLMGGTASNTMNEITILGNDYDRVVTANNGKTKFLIGLDGYSGNGHHTAGSDSLFASYTIMKSGIYGYNNDGTPNNDATAGMYIGGWSGLCVNSLTGTKVEGGVISVIVGGYGYNGTASTNSTYIGMSGGSVRSIYGGAGHSTTKGNRIINVTGGSVSYSVLGGSDSYNSGSTDDGIVDGSTLIYVGGNAKIGGGSGTLQGVEAGSVFGAGGGDTSSTQKGTVNNSHVIINGGTINTSVYGGGNYGSTGTQSSTSAKTVIDVLNGTMGDVYGGSKSAGFSKSNYINNSTIDINISGGSITNVYGGSNTDGTIYGGVTIDVTGGRITQNVYGGGKGNGTEVVQNVNVTIGSASVSGVPTIDGSVYGGSAFGVVNSSSSGGSASGNVTVTVNNGVITGNVFGGGQGNATYTPYVLGNINVTINGGDITGVFGGNDQAGNHNRTNEVHLNGGVVDNVYGGGNRSSVSVTHVYLSGATVTNLYGGSNTLGSVTSTSVSISSGTAQNIYGGNNEGGSCGVTNVNITGTAVINGSVYGGGNQVDTTTTNVVLNSASGTIPNVYGGGNNANVTTANITQNGVSVTNMFGGSNSGGAVNNSIITHNTGTTTNIYGGNNAGGNTVTSTINYINGTTTDIYGGGNEANGGESNINISGGTVTNTYGGGNRAGLTESNITVTSGSLTYVYGGSNNSGVVTDTHVLINNTSATIAGVFGGGNLAQVGDTEVIINNGSISNVYGGGNLAQVNGDTVVDINGGTIAQNIYGGGNFGVVKGDSNVTITDATIFGSAYAGGNGATATLEGNTTITIDGSTVIGTPTSVAPATGSVFGGGNQAFTGTSSADDSTSTVNIVGATIYGNVYGGANTSVIYGNTVVNIGRDTVTNSSALDCDDIYIKGHIFGGGEANAAGSEIYDWFFISVTQGTDINIDGNNHNSFDIDGSFYGGGNASSASGDSYLDIKNYGDITDPKTNISIQRVTYVTIDNSSMVLQGAIDRANEYDKEKFSISRVPHFVIKNNTSLFFETGANLLEEFQSLTSTGTAASVGISASSITKNVDNRVYMYEGKNLNIAKDQQVTDYGSVTGMTFLGIFNYDNNHHVNMGIYNPTYDNGDLLDWSGTFSRGSYVLGKHETNHDITVNGFYSNFIDEDTAINEVKYIEPTPADALFYMWFIGENVLEYNVNLVASKYSTLGAVEASFLEFSKPNTSFQILSFDGSEITTGVSLIDKDSIPRIASTSSSANNVFGLAMEASNSGWLTTGKTSFYTTVPSMSGVTYYEGENSNLVPTMLFYLYHSKNLTEEKDLGTARISVMAITKLNALSNEIKRLVINVNMSTALFQTTEYEGAMTPGDKYELFTSTTNNITTKSKFSAYYSLYSTNENLYRTGYHRVLSSNYVFPEHTKITMLNFVNGVPEYYYHIIDASDVSAASAEFQLEGDVSYPLSMFTKMGSRSNNSNYDDSVMNGIYYDGTDSNEEFIFIVDFSDTNINGNRLGNTLLIEMRDSQEETIMTVLGIQHSQLTYNLYSGYDSQINLTVTESNNPLYVGYNDILDVLVGYQSSTSGGVLITDTQYFSSKLGFQVYLLNGDGHVVSGTDLTGAYFSMDGVDYYPDINGYTHIKLSDKVGNAEKWIIFNTENASIATGDYVFVMETFGSPDGIYYSSGVSSEYRRTITIINSTYGLKVDIDEDTVVFDSDNDKDLKLTITYTSMLSNPNIRVMMYRRKYDQVYDTNYELVDFNDIMEYDFTETNNTYEYMIINGPRPTNQIVLSMDDELLTGTYRLVFRLCDNDTMIGDVIQYIIIK